MKKESNPPPPENLKRPTPPPAPPRVQVGRKLARKLRKVYIKQAQRDIQDVFEKASKWPLKQRIRLAIRILRGK